MNNLIGISGKINSGKDLVGEILQYLACSSSKEQTFEQWRFIQGIAPYSEFKIKKFADKLKEIVCLLIGCTREQLEDRVFKETPLGEEWNHYKVWDNKNNITIVPVSTNLSKFHDAELVQLTPRLLFQLLGTQCGRNIIHPNIWVNALFADYKPTFSKGITKDPSNWEMMDPILGKLEVITPKVIYTNWIITDVRFPNEAEAIKQRGGILIRINRPCKECHGLGFHKMDCNVGRTEHESEYALDRYKEFDYVIDNDGTIEDLVNKIKNLKICLKQDG